MVEYHIVIRWPYKPLIHRCMTTRETLIWMTYCILFGGLSEPAIRTYFAWEKSGGG